MKTTWRWALAALALLALVLAGCGGDDSGDSTTASDEAPATLEEIEVDTGPFDSDEEFVAAIDAACNDYGAFYERAPVYGVEAKGLEAEFGRRVPINEAYQTSMESIEPTETLADEYQDYLDAGRQLNENEREVLAAAEKGDVEEANRILGEDNMEAVEKYDAATEALGACDSTQPPDPENVAEAADAAADAPQPANTIDEAAEDYLAAFQSGDCKRIQEAQHSQMYAELLDDCSDLTASYEGNEVLATAQYGPVGAAMVGTEESSGYASFVLDPVTDELEYAGTIYTEPNGLEPPNEGIDAEDTVNTVLEAIRSDDVDALNETLPIDVIEGEGSFHQTGESITELGNDPEYAKRIVEDIKSDTEAQPELLGVNQVDAYYLLDTESTDYILVARHEPGSETDYAFAAYWAISE